MGRPDATTRRVHAFRDDALGAHDATALAALVRAGSVSPAELTQAAIARAESVSELNAVAHPSYDAPRTSVDPDAEFFGVPSFVKDNGDVAGMPTNHGSEAFTAHPARRDGKYVSQFLTSGLTVLGKTRLPEFGFNATTEFMTTEPTRNPWDPDHSVGASSGGSAALVAAGAVPIAHANDGGGSIRIPAAAAGLVGLKPSRGRHRDDPVSAALLVRVISEGVLTRTVRDTANFHAALETHWRNPALPALGRVSGPSKRRLRIGIFIDGVDGAVTDVETRAAVLHTAEVLTGLGHRVVEVPLPVKDSFADDFVLYWGLLAMLATRTGRLLHGQFDKSRLDGLTIGLKRHYDRHFLGTAGAIRRLRRSTAETSAVFDDVDLLLSPVLGHTTPPLGHLSPTTPFEVLIDRLRDYVAFTPLDNVAGTPAMSLPLAMTATGMPIGVQLHAAHGAERTLLEVAFELEEAIGFPLIAG